MDNKLNNSNASYIYFEANEFVELDKDNNKILKIFERKQYGNIINGPWVLGICKCKVNNN